SGTCYGNGQVSPLDPCMACDVARSTTSFSANDGASCDDGLFCTSADTCHSGTCMGSGSHCDDGVACDGVEMCDETMNRCIAALTTCATGMICDVASDTCIETC